jgi:putative ABC transport system permease protein
MGILVCGILIKNLMEMNTQSQIYEIGILRAIGAAKSSIFKIFIFQILFISMIGTIIGLIVRGWAIISIYRCHEQYIFLRRISCTHLINYKYIKLIL